MILRRNGMISEFMTFGMAEGDVDGLTLRSSFGNRPPLVKWQN